MNQPIRIRPGDRPLPVVLENDRGVGCRVYELVTGKKGKLSAQLQEVKPPLRDSVLRQIDRG